MAGGSAIVSPELTDEQYDQLVGFHKPGSIKRLKCKNFLTYADVDVKCGPRLNVVIGANGTGKSTILCAFCLGLGGEPKHLGRADDARLFIMHDEEEAEIEIELEPFENEETHVFKRKIERSKGGHNGRGASTFYINDEKVSAKAVRDLVTKKYFIAVDNLCQFLPQDRVGNFSGFGPQDLLIETEKSMSGNAGLYETHQKLIEMEADLKKGGSEVETMRDKLKRCEADNERLEREKERMEEREEAERQLKLLNNKLLWLVYDACREEAKNLKVQKDEAKNKLKEQQEKLQPLQEAHALYATEKKRYDARYNTLDDNIKKSMKEQDKQYAKADKHQDELEETIAKLNAAESEGRNAAAAVEQAKEKVAHLEAGLEDLPSKEDVDAAQKEAADEHRKIRPVFENAKRELMHAHETMKDLQEKKGQLLSKLTRMNDEKTQRREKIFRAFPELAKIHDWLQNNSTMFRRPVWGPIVCDITTKSNTAAACLEFHVPNALLKSFVVENKEDYDLLYKKIRHEMKIPINIQLVPNGKLLPVERQYSTNKMRALKEEHGVTGYLDDSFTAPDPILQALRTGARVHSVLIGGTKTQSSIDNNGLLDYLSQPETSGQELRGFAIFASKGERTFRYQGSISRYSKKIAMSQDELRPPKLLTPGVNPQAKLRLEEEIQTINQDLLERERSHNELRARKDGLEKQLQEALARLKNAKEATKSIQKHHQRLTSAKRKLREAEERATADNAGERKKLVRMIQARMKSIAAALEAHSDQQSQIMQFTFSQAGVRINQDVTAAALRHAEEEKAEATRGFKEAEVEVARIGRDFTAKKNAMKEAKLAAENEAPLEDENGSPLPLKAELEALPVTTIAETEAAIDEARAKVDGIDANPDVIRQYEERKREIEILRQQLSDLKDCKDLKLLDLKRMRAPWEQALQNSVEKVNALFSTYMAELGNAGEVRLKKGDEDLRRTDDEEGAGSTGSFKDWGIEIAVKFREASKLQALSARVQSGGERSVSTIMYLMALQELMASPFRCVDEINQGLDERNERLVFKRIVENSTQPPRRGNLRAHSGQYFLITPKLLPNLVEMEEEAVTILNIFNGPFGFDDPSAWNTEAFIEGAKRSLESDAESDEGDENSATRVNAESGRARKQRRQS